jgi:predicted small secreted protein
MMVKFNAAPKMLVSLICLLIAGCNTPFGTSIPAPGPQVQESYKAFANEATRRLGLSFGRSGYHAGWEHKQGEEAHYLPETDGAHYLQDGMEASFSIHLHSHPPGQPITSEFINLEFVTRDKDKGPWLLVLDDGFLYSMQDESERSTLPFGIEAGIKQAFGRDVIEYDDWLEDQRQKASQSAQQPIVKN